MRRKLGILSDHPEDLELIQSLLDTMRANHADFTNTFHALNEAASNPGADVRVCRGFTDGAAFDAWAAAWRSRLNSEGRSSDERARSMRGANPAYIPRNHRVEQIISAAVGQG